VTDAHILVLCPPRASIDPVQITQLAGWMRTARHCVAFTGAGISTSTGVPDFRSGMNTVLKTGAGVWTLRDAAEKEGKSSVSTPVLRVSTLQAIPSPSHMSLVGLYEVGLLKHLVSQNTDGLHRRSGFPPECLSELHGNSNLEVCARCGREYMRDFKTRSDTNGEGSHRHETGRVCGCGGRLRDTITNFGESLPEKPITLAHKAMHKADMCLTLGTSLCVEPAVDVPKIVHEKPNGRLVIVNLQSTPLDRMADLRINATIDTVFTRLMPKLGVAIPPFRLRRRVQITQFIRSVDDQPMMHIEGIDSQGAPVTLFRHVHVCESLSLTEPHVRPILALIDRRGEPNKAPPTHVPVRLEWMGHYGEPPLQLQVRLRNHSVQTWSLEYDPVETGRWTKIEMVDERTGDDADRAVLHAAGRNQAIKRTIDTDAPSSRSHSAPTSTTDNTQAHTPRTSSSSAAIGSIPSLANSLVQLTSRRPGPNLPPPTACEPIPSTSRRPRARRLYHVTVMIKPRPRRTNKPTSAASSTTRATSPMDDGDDRLATATKDGSGSTAMTTMESSRGHMTDELQ
jgi:NAD-dependent SIR2 family protein deacetylase